MQLPLNLEAIRYLGVGALLATISVALFHFGLPLAEPLFSPSLWALTVSLALAPLSSLLHGKYTFRAEGVRSRFWYLLMTQLAFLLVITPGIVWLLTEARVHATLAFVPPSGACVCSLKP
jgi:hypothetical protein